MKKLAFIVLLLSLGSAATAQPKKTANHTPDPGNLTSVSIYHTACFGRCPEYKIEINKNGMATYSGIRFVPDSGIYTKNIGKKAATAILASFARFNWDTFPNRYEAMIEDLPGLIITVNYGKKTKSIQNAHFGPKTLNALRKKLDDVIERKLDESGLQPVDKSWRRTGNYKYE